MLTISSSLVVLDSIYTAWRGRKGHVSRENFIKILIEEYRRKAARKSRKMSADNLFNRSPLVVVADDEHLMMMLVKE